MTKLLICPYNFTGSNDISHTGLYISATNTARVLRANGINAVVRPVRNYDDIILKINEEKPTHVVINALWLPTLNLKQLITYYTDIHFALLVHSNIAFLQVEPGGINLLRQAVNLELSSIGNFNIAANSRLGQRGLMDSWECPTEYLPNLYFLDDTVRLNRNKWQGGTLRIGAFGALRPLKNPTASAFSALAIANNLATDLEYHINVGRNDSGGATNIINSIRAIFRNSPNAKLVEDNWREWPNFRLLVRGMHLLLQPSFTESFNVVTADGVAEGIASVVSNVIEWAPDYWKCNPDSTEDITMKGLTLLNINRTAQDGYNSLTAHNRNGVNQWNNWLNKRFTSTI